MSVFAPYYILDNSYDNNEISTFFLFFIFEPARNFNKEPKSWQGTKQAIQNKREFYIETNYRKL